ncbi:hypothetical protein DFS34DRAFT_333659 [Phlyctochytrium arcticum]|nr:hypothetical protein DFS34DRAFT_333659 [Phlyctochytrium arcticum]
MSARPRDRPSRLQIIRAWYDHDSLEANPLLNDIEQTPEEDSPRSPHRVISSDGTKVIIYTSPFSNTVSQHFGPPAFSFELPPSLDNILPAPTYRSHVATLNILFHTALSEREKRRRQFDATLMSIFGALFLCWAWSLVSVPQMWATGLVAIVLLMMLTAAVLPLLARLSFADLQQELEAEIYSNVLAWTARAPPNMYFQVHNVFSLINHPRFIPKELSRPPEFHVVLVDPSPGFDAGSIDESRVILTPEADGLMMSVKVAPRNSDPPLYNSSV